MTEFEGKKKQNEQIDIEYKQNQDYTHQAQKTLK